MKIVRRNLDRLSALMLTATGLLALTMGWFGVSRELLPAGQMPYVISGGLFGLFMLGLAGTLWLSADLRDEWRQLDELNRKLDELAAHETIPKSKTQITDSSAMPEPVNPAPFTHE